MENIILSSNLFILFFFLFRATPVAYGGSQPRGLIGAMAMQDPSHICKLHHSSEQHWILNPLRQARDQTCCLMVTSQIHFHYTMGIPILQYLKMISVVLISSCNSADQALKIGQFTDDNNLIQTTKLLLSFDYRSSTKCGIFCTYSEGSPKTVNITRYGQQYTSCFCPRAMLTFQRYLDLLDIPQIINGSLYHVYRQMSTKLQVAQRAL